jgi:vesicle-fusing ATPase
MNKMDNLDYYIDNKVNADDEIVKECLAKIHKFKEEKISIYQLLIIGEVGSLKTNISAYIAKSTEFEYIKVLSNINMIGMSERDKIMQIKSAFDEAYKHSRACIVLDSLELIVEYHRDTKTNKLRFMSFLFNTIKTLLKKHMPNCQIFVIINSIKLPGLDLDDYIDDYLLLN